TGMNTLKDIAQILYYVVAMVAAVGALQVYRRNSRLERAKWATKLFEKFYEEDRYKVIRGKLDVPADSETVRSIVLEETTEFTDYLNFFEFVTFLRDSKELRNEEIEALFGYFLGCLGRHDRIREHINSPGNGYERLKAMLNSNLNQRPGM